MRILRFRRAKRKAEKLNGLNRFALSQKFSPIIKKRQQANLNRTGLLPFYDTFIIRLSISLIVLKAFVSDNGDYSNDARERASVPARIRTNPISALTVNFSFSAKKENAIVTNMLSLSTETTTETTPSFKAL